MSGYFGLPMGDLDRLIGQPAPVVIGDMVLQGHEVPGRISIGGLQAVKVHKLPGGGRIIDAMGADPGAISWRGLFVGPDAAMRARTLDLMRQQGLPRILSFGDYSFTVVITEFEYDYKDRGAVVSYRIRSEIVPDPAGGIDATSSASAAVLGDFGTIGGLMQAGSAAMALYDGLSSRSDAARATTLSAMLTSLGSDLATASGSVSASEGGTVLPASLQTQLQASGAAMQAAIAFAGAGCLNPTTAGTAFTSASGLVTATGQAAALAALVQAAGYVNRISANAATASGQPLAPLIHA